MKLPSPCAADCVWAGVDEQQAFSLTVSVRDEYSCVYQDRVLKMIPGASHRAAHPLYIASDTTDAAARRGLLQRIASEPCPNVLPVTAVCRCSFESPLLTGEPLRDFALGPDGKMLTPPALRKPRWPPQMVQKFLFELVEGLQCLHQQGIAHGDPVLLNAFVQTAAEGERAVWVDLSSVREATEEARLMDSAAFVELCLWPMMLDSEIHSESLMRDVVAAECCAPDVLVGLHDALSVSRTDYARKDGRELRGSIFRDVDVLGRSDDFGRIRRRLCALLAAPYVLDYTISDASARFAMSLLDAERTRNAIFEEERSRLQYLEFHKEREELRKWVAELQQAVAYHNTRAEKLESELNKTADALKEAQAHSRELQAAVDYHRVRSEALEQNFERVQEQQNVLVNELKKTSAELGAALSRIRDLDTAIDRHNQRSWYRRLVQPIV